MVNKIVIVPKPQSFLIENFEIHSSKLLQLHEFTLFITFIFKRSLRNPPGFQNVECTPDRVGHT